MSLQLLSAIGFLCDFCMKAAGLHKGARLQKGSHKNCEKRGTRPYLSASRVFKAVAFRFIPDSFVRFIALRRKRSA
jgi:hypothetical protein